MANFAMCAWKLDLIDPASLGWQQYVGAQNESALFVSCLECIIPTYAYVGLFFNRINRKNEESWNYWLIIVLSAFFSTLDKSKKLC